MTNLIQPIVLWNNPLLKTVSIPFNECGPGVNTETRELFAKLMSDNLIYYRGLGLAAIQIGFPFRVFSLNLGDNIETYFDPVVEPNLGGQMTMEEGCLSFPGLALPIQRPKTVKLSWTDVNKQSHVETFGGMTARAILHEMDHLDGILFTALAHPYHRGKKVNKWLKRMGR